MADEVDLAKAVAGVALSTPGGHSLGARRYVETATYGVGKRVLGVVRPGEVEVHVVARYPLEKEAASVVGLAGMVRERTAPQAGERKVTVVVEDIAEEPEGAAV